MIYDISCRAVKHVVNHISYAHAAPGPVEPSGAPDARLVGRPGDLREGAACHTASISMYFDVFLSSFKPFGMWIMIYRL